MIYLIHRGWGGRYTNYVAQNVKNICRMRNTTLTPMEPVNGGYRVAISSSGTPITDERLKNILSHPRVSFYFGDSNKLPDDVIAQADEVVSLSSLGLSYQLEAAILTASLEQTLLNYSSCRV